MGLCPGLGCKSLHIYTRRHNEHLFTSLKVAELANYRTHAILRDLRPAGTAKRGIPYGLGFDFVSCPNYTFEIAAWLAIIMMSGSIGG